MKIAVLISGRGSNLEALIKHQIGYQVAHVISNNFHARGLQIAKQHGIINTCIDWTDPVKAEKMLVDLLQDSPIDLIVLAGFMRILSADFVNQFSDKILNIHPSLLPKYPGLNTHQKVLDNNDKSHGASVHLVDEGLDQGPVIAQTAITVHESDDKESLADRLILKEHKLLTTVMGLIATGDLQWNKQNITWKQKTLNKPLMIE